MLEDRFWIRRQSVLGQEIAQPRADNGDVVINIVEAMAGAIDLSGIRARDNTDRPFTRIQEIEREAEQQYRQRQRELEQALSDIRSRLSRLRGGGDVEGLEAGGDTILTEEQEQAIQEAEAELLRLREQLREVQRQLRAEKEAVRATLQTVNIGAVPLVVALIAIGLAVARQIRRTRRAREAAEG
jgi:ABC-type uncharacterized transport system involved in gliding motility auxiliary subunit